MEWSNNRRNQRESMDHPHLDDFVVDPAFLVQAPAAPGPQLMPAIPTNPPNWTSPSSHKLPHSSSPNDWMSGLDGDCDLSPPPGGVAQPSQALSAYEQPPVESLAALYMTSGQPRQYPGSANANMASRLAPSNKGKIQGQHNAVHTAQTPSSSEPSPSSPPILECKWEGCQCSTRFSREGDLVRHVKTIHISPDAYSCQYCGKSFGRRDHRREHQKRRHRVYQ